MLHYQAIDLGNGAFAVDMVDPSDKFRGRVVTFGSEYRRCPRTAAQDYADWSNRQHAANTKVTDEEYLALSREFDSFSQLDS